ncbi:hypothetical protein [Simkania sp.]|uniref:hypothetical protein n=1 Tax=Simkania sp. TaxID=34094 RepID=UPI003B51B41D
MTNSVSMSSLVFNGTAATAQNAVYQIMALYSTMSSQYDKLMILDTVSSYKSSESTAKNTEKAADQQASQTRDQAFGEIALGGITLGGVGLAMTYSTYAERDLTDESNELKSMKKYQSATEEALKNDPGSRLSNFAGEEDLETQQNKAKIDELSHASNFSKRIFTEDKAAIDLADENELKKVSKHLNSRTSDLEQKLNDARKEISKKSDRIDHVAGAVGQIGRASAQMVAANHQEEAGKYKSQKVMSESGGKMMDQLYQQSAQNASKYLDLSLQLVEILTGLQQADSSQT